MKKLSIVVTILVLMFSTQLSLAATPITDDITADRIMASMVDYMSTKTITYHQQKPIEIDKIRNNKEVVLVMDTSSEMNSYVTHDPSPFDSALFSGGTENDLFSASTTLNIKGNVHSNSGISMQARDTNIDGKISAVNNISVSINTNTNSPESTTGVAPIPMQDLSSFFQASAEKNMSKFSKATNPLTGVAWYRDICTQYGQFNYMGEYSSKYLGCNIPADTNGKWTLNGDNLLLKENRPLYFDGDLEINVSSITGNGFIVATGNITFNTGSFTGANIGIYSVKGDVSFHSGVSGLEGLIYAPGNDVTNTGGNLNFNTGNLDMTGSIVARSITARTGDINIKYKQTSLHDDIMEYSNISKHITVAKAATNNFINKLAQYYESDIKMSVITYDDNAEILGDKFFNIKSGTDRQILINSVNGIEINVDATTPVGSNLGDGLRRAYYMLEESLDKKADKYIVVLSGSEPNKWTKNLGLEAGKYMTMPGLVSNSSYLISSLKDDGKTYQDAYAYEYACKIGEMIKGSANPIKSFFIDVKSGGDLTGITDDKSETIGSTVITPNAIVSAAGAVVYNPEADGDAFDFGTMLQKNLVTDIGNKILNDASYVNPLVTATFTDIIPMGVEVKDPSILVPTKLNEITTLKLNNAKINTIDKVGTTDKILGKIQDIEIKVKYNKKGTMSFWNRSITYTITNPVTGILIEERIVNINRKEVTVGWVIDIN